WFAGGWSIFLVSLFFISSTLIISLVIRRYQDNLRLSELKNRLALEKEVLGRDQVIKVKTQEAINLASLSMQFSPQVVRAIRTGEKKLEGGTQRAQICVIFIDIVGSTERVTRIDKDDVNKVISMFMDDTIRTLLKYDITIDKFLGDGVLAFSNNPIAHPDYIERVLRAALEIRVNITEHKDEYLDYWKRQSNRRQPRRRQTGFTRSLRF
ncbi:MAG: adenylate/guanylate cyclase domain-containing protein, partial [Deltaproteobacteria bacterium]|nr:adenylate/guanylate cyclase domain-containing protein [Deltaproteobacteria bacterium]